MKLISSLYSCIRSNNTYNSWSLSNYKKVSSKDFDYLLSLLISNPINLWQPSLCLKTIIFWIKICVLPSYSVQKKQTNKNNNTNNQNKNKKKGAKVLSYPWQGKMFCGLEITASVLLTGLNCSYNVSSCQQGAEDHIIFSINFIVVWECFQCKNKRSFKMAGTIDSFWQYGVIA